MLGDNLRHAIDCTYRFSLLTNPPMFKSVVASRSMGLGQSSAYDTLATALSGSGVTHSRLTDRTSQALEGSQGFVLRVHSFSLVNLRPVFMRYET